MPQVDLHGCDAAFVLFHSDRLSLGRAIGPRAAALALGRSEWLALPASADRLASFEPAEAACCAVFRRVGEGDGHERALPISLNLFLRPGVQNVSIAVALLFGSTAIEPRGTLTLSVVGLGASVDRGGGQIDLGAEPDARPAPREGVYLLHARVAAVEPGLHTLALHRGGVSGALPLWVAGSVWS